MRDGRLFGDDQIGEPAYVVDNGEMALSSRVRAPALCRIDHLTCDLAICRLIVSLASCWHLPAAEMSVES
jgi:hypothetical protein